MTIFYLYGTKSDRTEFILNSNSKVLIIGSNGISKSSLSKAICEKYCLHNIELDELIVNKVEDEENILKIQSEKNNKDGYVINGSYRMIHYLAWLSCETVIWLDYSPYIVLLGTIRILFRKVFCKDITIKIDIKMILKEIKMFSWNEYTIKKREYLKSLYSDEYNIKQFIIIRSPKKINDLMNRRADF